MRLTTEQKLLIEVIICMLIQELNTRVALLQLLIMTTIALNAHIGTMMKIRHHFWYQTFDVVDCLNPLTNLHLLSTDCPWFRSVNKLLEMAPIQNVKVKKGKVG